MQRFESRSLVTNIINTAKKGIYMYGFFGGCCFFYSVIQKCVMSVALSQTENLADAGAVTGSAHVAMVTGTKRGARPPRRHPHRGSRGMRGRPRRPPGPDPEANEAPGLYPPACTAALVTASLPETGG